MPAKVDLSCENDCFTLEVRVEHDERDELELLRELVRDDLGECEACETAIFPTYHANADSLHEM